MAFVTKYRIEFEEKIFPSSGSSSYSKDRWQINILEDGFGGTLSYLNAGENPLEINYSNIDLYRSPIMESEAVITMVLDSTNQVSDITLANDLTYKVEINRNSTLFWTGWVSAGDYEEEYNNDRAIEASIRCSDGLDKLSAFDIDVSSGGTTRDLMQTIDDCIGNLSLGLSYKENVNWYDSLMDSAASDSPLDQAKIYPGTWYTNNENEVKNCRDVLESILVSFGCVMVQKDGYWYINQISENDGSAYTLREFNSSHVYQSNSSVNPTITLTNFGDSQIRLQSILKHKRPIKKVSATVNLDRGHNLVIDGEFDDNAWYDVNPGGPSTFALSRWQESSATATRLALSGSTIDTYSACDIATGTTGGYIYSEWQRTSASVTTLDFSFCYKIIYTSTGTATVKYMIEYLSDDLSGYSVNGSGNWAAGATTTISVSADDEEDDVWVRVLKTNIDAPPENGWIRVRLYEVEPGTATISDFYVDQVRLIPDSLTDMSDENYKIKTTDSDTFSLSLEVDATLADKGTWSRYDFRTGNYANLVFYVDFDTLVNGSQVSFDILGTNRTFEYQSSPSIGQDEFNSISSLVSLVQAYTGDHYSVWSTIQGLNQWNLEIIAHFREVETGEDYNWGTPTYGTGFSSVTDVNDSAPGSITSTDNINYGVILVANNGDEDRAGQWTDGNISGNLLFLLFNYIHANYGDVNQQHRGKLMDWSKTTGPTMLLTDPLNNNGKYFLFTGGTFNPLYGEWDGQWQEVKTTKKTITKEYIAI